VLALGVAGYCFLFKHGLYRRLAGGACLCGFCRRLLRPGILIAFTAFLLRPSLAKGLIVAVALIIPFVNAFFYLRRIGGVGFHSPLALLPLYYIRKWVIPRTFIAAGIVIVFLVVTVFPLYRDYSEQSNRTARTVNIRGGDR